MAAFTELKRRVEQLRSQRLARIATGDSAGMVAAGFRVSADAAAIEVGGRNFGQTKRCQIGRSHRVALVTPDLASITGGGLRAASRGQGRLALHDDAGGGPAQSHISLGRRSR